MARRPTVAERDDLESRIDALKEALRDLLWLKDMEDAGQALPDMAAYWRRNWALARDALGEDGPDDRRSV